LIKFHSTAYGLGRPNIIPGSYHHIAKTRSIAPIFYTVDA